MTDLKLAGRHAAKPTPEEYLEAIKKLGTRAMRRKDEDAYAVAWKEHNRLDGVKVTRFMQFQNGQKTHGATKFGGEPYEVSLAKVANVLTREWQSTREIADKALAGEDNALERCRIRLLALIRQGEAQRDRTRYSPAYWRRAG